MVKSKPSCDVKGLNKMTFDEFYRDSKGKLSAFKRNCFFFKQLLSFTKLKLNFSNNFQTLYGIIRIFIQALIVNINYKKYIGIQIINNHQYQVTYGME